MIFIPISAGCLMTLTMAFAAWGFRPASIIAEKGLFWIYTAGAIGCGLATAAMPFLFASH